MRMADTLNVCTYNVWFMPPLITLFAHRFGVNLSPRKQTRAALIAESVPENLDIVVLCEAFCQKATNTLCKSLEARHGLKYRTQVLGRKGLGKLLSGGVVVVSKRPIIETDELVFGQVYARDDGLANKGVLYAKIAMDNDSGSTGSRRHAHVFATHTQAWDTPNCKAARAKQMEMVRDFIKSKAIPQDELVLVVGDLNVPRETEEYEVMLTILDATNPNLTDLTNPSFNHITNYLASGGPSSGGSSTTLDYILVSKGHLQPLEATAETISLKAKSKYPLKGKEVDDLSDHYPVIATIKLPSQGT